MFSTLFNKYIFINGDFPYILRCFQSRLLQICCMWALKALWQKKNLMIMNNFFFCHYVFKKLSAVEVSESVFMRERVKLNYITLITNILSGNISHKFVCKWESVKIILVWEMSVLDYRGICSSELLFIEVTLTPLQQTAFWKHSDKRRNYSKQAISHFATMFSTFSHRLSILL